MPQGLQLWDAAGNIQIDTNDRITRYLGSVVINVDGASSPSGASGTIYNDGFYSGTPWWYFRRTDVVYEGFGSSVIFDSLTASVTGNALTWSVPPYLSAHGTLLIGVW